MDPPTTKLTTQVTLIRGHGLLDFSPLHIFTTIAFKECHVLISKHALTIKSEYGVNGEICIRQIGTTDRG